MQKRHQITEKIFYKYLKCPSWISYERDKKRQAKDALLELLQDEGLLRHQELDLLKNQEVKEVHREDVDEAFQQTLEYMKAGVQTIYKPVLIDHHYVARPDILEKVEGKSLFGDYYYVACDIKRSSHLKDEYRLQGSFYGFLLEKLQGIKPVKGYVMHGDGYLEGYLLEELEVKFHLTLDAIEDILDGKDEAHFLTSACKQSPWFSLCESGAHECRDLSLINRIWKSEVDALKSAGIQDIDELASAKGEVLNRVKDITGDRLDILQKQAQAIKKNTFISLGKVDFEEEKEALVIDIESDPLRDLHYLFGVLHIKNGKETFYAFLADNPEDEEKNWHEFVEFLKDHSELNIYHYGWYEQDVFRRMSEKYGAPERVEDMFEDQMIDVLLKMREKVIFPMPFYSLKDIAKYIGFKWRIPEATGLKSILWYHDWVDHQNKDALNDIVEYNEDDVRATWLVRNWALENT